MHYATHMWEQGNTRIISFDSTSLSDHDIRLYKKDNFLDNSGTEQWNLISGYNFGPGTRAFDAVGGGIFIGNTSVQQHIGYFVINEQGDFSLISTLNLPRPYATSTPIIREVTHMGDGYIALGTEKWEGPEFVIIRIDPSGSMSTVYSHEIGSIVSKIIVSNNNLILGTGSMQEVLFFDTTQKNNPVLKDSLVFPGYATHDVTSLVWTSSSTFMVGRSVGGFNVVHEPELVHVSIRDDQVWVNELFDTGSSVYGIRDYGSASEVNNMYTLATNKLSIGIRDFFGSNGFSTTTRAQAVNFSECNGRYHYGMHL